MMPIRLIEEKDYEKLTSLYKAFFKTHTLFQREREIVIAYILKEALEREFLVYEEQGLIKGALVIVNKGTNANGSHKRWKFRHIAFESERIGKELLAEAEKRVRQQSATAKVELTIAESEEGLDFYKKQEYAQEGTLLNHYRWGEKCYILGKSFL